MFAVVSQNAIFFVDDGPLFARKRLDFYRNSSIIRLGVDCFQHLRFVGKIQFQWVALNSRGLTFAQAPVAISSPNVNRLPGSGNESNDKFIPRIFSSQFLSFQQTLQSQPDTFDDSTQLNRTYCSLAHFIGLTIMKIVHVEAIPMKSIELMLTTIRTWTRHDRIKSVYTEKKSKRKSFVQRVTLFCTSSLKSELRMCL